MLSFLLLLLVAADKPQAHSVAMVVAGTGRLERAERAPKPIRVMDLLLESDKLVAGPNGEIAIVFFSDAHRETLKNAGSVTVGSRQCEPQSSVTKTPPLSAKGSVIQSS